MENGARAVFTGGIEWDRLMDQRYFYPFYEICQELDLAITLHAGVGSFNYHDGLPRTAAALMIFKFPILGAFNAILEDELPKSFPQLRWAFIEASAQWVPYLLGEVKIQLARKSLRMSDSILNDSNFYITTQKTDDLNCLLSEIGDDNLLIGTDYGHRDTAPEVEALKRLSEDGSVSEASIDQILRTNPGKLSAIARRSGRPAAQDRA